MRAGKRDRLIAALLSEPTREAAATKAGISPATLFRALADPQFQTALREAQSQAFNGAMADLQTAAGEAVRTLRRNLNSEKPADSNRAAAEILSHARASVEMMEIVERLQALEQAIEAKRAPGRAGISANGYHHN